MKATGIVRKIDELGRLVIPKEIRRTFDINEKDPMEVYVTENQDIVLRKYNQGCNCCGKIEKNMFHVLDMKLCSSCIDDFNRARNTIRSAINK